MLKLGIVTTASTSWHHQQLYVPFFLPIPQDMGGKKGTDSIKLESVVYVLTDSIININIIILTRQTQ